MLTFTYESREGYQDTDFKSDFPAEFSIIMARKTKSTRWRSLPVFLNGVLYNLYTNSLKKNRNQPPLSLLRQGRSMLRLKVSRKKRHSLSIFAGPIYGYDVYPIFMTRPVPQIHLFYSVLFCSVLSIYLSMEMI